MDVLYRTTGKIHLPIFTHSIFLVKPSYYCVVVLKPSKLPLALVWKKRVGGIAKDIVYTVMMIAVEG